MMTVATVEMTKTQRIVEIINVENIIILFIAKVQNSFGKFEKQ